MTATTKTIGTCAQCDHWHRLRGQGTVGWCIIVDIDQEIWMDDYHTKRVQYVAWCQLRGRSTRHKASYD